MSRRNPSSAFSSGCSLDEALTSTSPPNVGSFSPPRTPSFSASFSSSSFDRNGDYVRATSFPKNKIRVLLCESVHDAAVRMLQAEGFDVECVKHALTEEELLERVPQVHVLGIRSKTRVSARVLERAERLLAVGCFCIGTDQVDLRAAERRAIPVFNAPFANTRSVAELMVGEIIALSRQLADRSSECHAGNWFKSAVNCVEVRGKTLGIVGYGHIGAQLSILAEGMGMHVVYYDVVPVLPLGNARPCATLEELLAQADYVSLHVPKTDATHMMIGAPQLGRMKRGAVLLNASRGTVVDLDALAAALRSGHLNGAAVDVYPAEPEKNGERVFSTPLAGCRNVILTPHIGGSTKEAQAKIGEEVAVALVKLVNTGCTVGAVNFPNVELTSTRGCHRILNTHRNVPGVLRDVNRIFADTGANVRAQILGTTNEIGYLLVDLDKEASRETKKLIAALQASLRTRILY